MIHIIIKHFSENCGNILLKICIIFVDYCETFADFFRNDNKKAPRIVIRFTKLLRGAMLFYRIRKCGERTHSLFPAQTFTLMR